MVDPEMDAMEERFHHTLSDFYHNLNWKALLNGAIQRTPNGFFYEHFAQITRWDKYERR